MQTKRRAPRPLPAPAFLALALLAPALAGAPQAQAAASIGQATAVERNASGDAGGARRALSTGDPVEARETIQTDGRGRAAFRFVDDTRLSVGPNSSVRLDKFVFATDRSPSAFVIRASRGLLRFSTGRGDHEAYRIDTPTASIGVRGTRFDVKIERGQARVSVLEGEVVLCPIRGRPNFLDCVTAQAGKTILSTLGKARVVLTSTLPRIRADLLLPLPTLAGALPALPLRGDLGGAIRDAAAPVGDALPLPRPRDVGRAADGAVGRTEGGIGGAAGAVGNAVGGLVGPAGGLGGAAGGAIGGIGGALGGLGGIAPRLGR